MAGVTQTPNIKLNLVPADFKNWTDLANSNSKLLDAIVSAYFTVQNLQGLWQNSTMYAAGVTVVDETSSVVYKVNIAHTSAAVPTTFLQDRTAHPDYWTVYSSPARSRGAWTGPGTQYALNDFVVSGAQYAICIAANESGATFATDLASGFWSVLVDLSTAGSQVLPVPGGAADANKFVMVAATGNGYTITSAVDIRTILGITSIGVALIHATSAFDALAAIGGQPAGDYQPGDASLDTLSGKSIGNYGLTLLAMSALADLKTAIGLGTAAYLAAGAAPFNLVQLDATAKLPALDASALFNLTVLAGAQIQKRRSYIVAVNSGTETIPYDDTIPQITEGHQFLSRAITPQSATSNLDIEVVFNYECSATDIVIAALFRDAVADAIAADADWIGAANVPGQIVLKTSVVSGSTAPTTFTVRAGANSGGTVTFNGSGGVRKLGGVYVSSITVTEVM